MKSKGHRIIKAGILLFIMVLVNTLLGILVSSFYNIIIKLQSNTDNYALIIYWTSIVIPVILNCLIVYHMPGWVDSWVKAKGEWYLNFQIEYMQDLIARNEAEPQTLKEIYEKNKPKVEKALSKALISGSKK